MALALVSTGDYLSATIIGVTASIVLISAIATVLIHHRLGHGGALERELLHVATVACLLAFAELTPKTYGSLFADDVALMVAPFVAMATRLLGPASAAIAAISSRLLKLLRMPPLTAGHIVTEEEIKAAADIGEEEGAVEPEEGALLDHIIDLGELTAGDVMVPRIDVVGVPADATLDQALEVATASGFSRFPVYEDTIDNVVGVIHVNDLMRALLTGRDWREFIREPVAVPESASLADVFQELRRAKTHMAVVVDEFGGTSGIVTVEDILEELVGEIRDEHERVGREDVIAVGEGEVVASGKARLSDVFERLGIEAPSAEGETVAGILAELSGRIPRSGESFEYEGVRFVVEESDGQHVRRVRVIAPRGEKAGEQAR